MKQPHDLLAEVEGDPPLLRQNVVEFPQADVEESRSLGEPPRPHQMTELHPQWSRCRPWIEAALEHDPLTVPEVEARMKAGNAQLWPGKDAAVVTEIVTYDNGLKVYQTVAAGGDMAEIEQMIPGIEAYGRMMGCTVARIEGRMGWQKRMKAFGYQFHSVILSKPL